MNSFHQSIFNWLSSKHIRVPREWVQECVSFLESEGISQDKMRESVYEQWLVSDLETLQEAIIDVATCDGKWLKGTYSLQINYIIDISKSRFSQLRALLGTNDGNIDVQAFEDPNTKWEPKPSRCLLLELTDGINKVKAIEVEPICELSANLQAGTKVLVKGPVRRAHGCLLLKRGSVAILGGHVEELLERYSQPSILNNLLQSVNINGHKELCSKKFPNAGKIKGARKEIKLSAQVKPSPSQYRPPVINIAASDHIRHNSQRIHKPVQPIKQEGFTEWDDEMSDSEFITDPKVKADTADCSLPSDWSDVEAEPAEVKKSPKVSSMSSTSWAREGFRPAEEVEWSDEDFSYEPTKQNLDSAPNSTKTPIISVSEEVIDNDDIVNKHEFEDSIHWSDDDEKMDSAIHPMSKGAAQGRTYIQPISNESVPRANISSMLKGAPKGVPISISNEDVVDLLSTDEDDDNIPPSDTEDKLKGVGAIGTKINSFFSTSNTKEPVTKSPHLSEGDSQSVERPTVGAKAINRCSDFHKSRFHYLSELSDSTVNGRPASIIVKAHISTVIDKIGTTKDKSSWTLGVRINDGTDYLDCQICHQILKDAIGPVKQTVKDSKSNTTQRRIIIQKMRNFGDWLSSVNSMMELKIPETGPPLILSIRQPTSDDVTLFRQCLAQK